MTLGNEHGDERQEYLIALGEFLFFFFISVLDTSMIVTKTHQQFLDLKLFRNIYQNGCSINF